MMEGKKSSFQLWLIIVLYTLLLEQHLTHTSTILILPTLLALAFHQKPNLIL